jgi:thiol-disulfide isomerase/thioredoxin
LRRAALLAVLVVAAGAACSSAPDFRFVALSGPMPSLAGPTLQGGAVDPGTLAGKVVLINFWASWCGPCRREQPGLETLWRRLQPSGRVQFVGVDHLDNHGAAVRWIDRYGVTYPSLPDTDGRIGSRFDVPFLPATVLVDAGGHLRYRLIGAQDPQFLAGLLAAVAALGSPADSVQARASALSSWRPAWYDDRTRGPASTWANPIRRPSSA